MTNGVGPNHVPAPCRDVIGWRRNRSSGVLFGRWYRNHTDTGGPLPTPDGFVSVLYRADHPNHGHPEELLLHAFGKL